MINLSIVIPLYNEAESLPELYAWIKTVATNNKLSYELIFVDDGSKDTSWSVIERLAAEDSNIAPSTVPNRSRSTGTRSIERANGARKRGVTSLGLIITAQPAASAGIASMQPSSNGKFHGLITPTN